MRRWAIEMSPQGPVYLGYRLGHIKAEGRVFRALVYNKGAMVLHMLRRLMGDEAFFAGLRDFYATWRYKKAGTDDFRVAMEKAGGRPLERFFERWIYGSAIPTVRFTSQIDGSQLRVRFEQKGDVFDIPITVTIVYTDGTSEDVIVKVTEATTERVIPLKGAVRVRRGQQGRRGAGGDREVGGSGCGVRTRNFRPRTALGQINPADPRLAVPLERLVDDDEAEAGVFVEARQPLAEAARSDSSRPLSALRPRLEVTAAAVSPTRISLPSWNGSTGTETAPAGTAAGIAAMGAGSSAAAIARGAAHDPAEISDPTATVAARKPPRSPIRGRMPAADEVRPWGLLAGKRGRVRLGRLLLCRPGSSGYMIGKLWRP